jgi:hypothetical protein
MAAASSGPAVFGTCPVRPRSCLVGGVHRLGPVGAVRAEIFIHAGRKMSSFPGREGVRLLVSGVS